MKCLLFFLLALAGIAPAGAQLVFRNRSRDTIRIAVGTFYDTSRKAMMDEAGKPVMVRGWYRLHPGDSLVQRSFIGPAVYYAREIIRNNSFIIGDTVFGSESERTVANYRERFYTGYNRPLSDTAKFQIKHPYAPVGEPKKMVANEFRIALVTAEARRAGRLVIELGAARIKE